MNTPLPAHLVAGIRQRIALLREAWQIDEVYASPRHTGYPMAPTSPQPHSNDARSRS
jgi:hypothetical protein